MKLHSSNIYTAVSISVYRYAFMNIIRLLV